MQNIPKLFMSEKQECNLKNQETFIILLLQEPICHVQIGILAQMLT